MGADEIRRKHICSLFAEPVVVYGNCCMSLLTRLHKLGCRTTLIWSQATVCMSLLLLFSSIYLRRNFYELFLLIHITFSVVVIVGLFM